MARKQPRRITSRRGSGKGRSGADTKSRSNGIIASFSRKTKTVRVPLSKLPARSKAARDRALHALSLIRRRGYRLTDALKEEKLSAATFRKYVGPALLPSKPGQRIRVTTSDSFAREMLLPSALGDVPIKVHGYRNASFLAEYRKAVLGYLRGHGADTLKAFEGKLIEGHELITDPQTLSALAEQGAIKPEQFYASVGGEA